MSILMAMMGSLGAGVEPVVDKSFLLAAIQAAQALDEEDYTPASWANLEIAVDAGQLVYDDPLATQGQVDLAEQDIYDAIDALVSSSDPYFDNVSLLLPFSGAVGVYEAVDASPRTKIASNAGTPTQLPFNTTDTFKWPPTSGRVGFPTTGFINYLTADNDFRLGTSFTVEGWFNFPEYPTGTSRGIWIAGDVNTNAQRAQAMITAQGTINFLIMPSSGTVTIQTPLATPLPLNTWHHLAWVKDEDDMYIFVNGEKVAEGFSPALPVTYPGIFRVGRAREGGLIRNAPNSYWNDFRVTKDVARYTSDFSVPTAPFPTS